MSDSVLNYSVPEAQNTSKEELTQADSLHNLTKVELISRIHALEAHVLQLRNVISKHSNSSDGKVGVKTPREFNFKRYRKRHVALKICYLGWNYQGLAVQEDTQKTIETEIFNALTTTKLIESRATSNYHRCGRTDKEVSAFGQVLSITLRSKFLAEDVQNENIESFKIEDEINYCHILNKVLPPEIRVLAWAPVHPDFSSRFSCKSRTYKYFFPRGDLNIERMREASVFFVGEHDFRNLCKMDVGGGVTNFVRRIIDVTIAPVSPQQHQTDYELFHVTVKGQSFLWHQIRCMVAVLFLIGKGLEEPKLVKELLDVETNSRKPQYNMAEGFPLVLFDCHFDDVEWIYDSEALSNTIGHLQEMWSGYAIRAGMIKYMLDDLESVSTGKCSELSIPSNQNQSLVMGGRSKMYKSLLNRPRCESLESRLEQLQKRRKKQ